MDDPTYGQKSVEFVFGSSDDPMVQRLGELFADIIDICNDLRPPFQDGERSRMATIAITQAQTAAMWAEKAITYQE